MSKEQDLLFCKIAISSGMVSQEMAQKALALANRFEAEGKRRPQVGAIFIKQNLLNTADVQRIYGAVQKRLEAQFGTRSGAATAVRQQTAQAAPPQARAAAGARPAARRAAQLRQPPQPVGKAVRASHKPSTERIDPITLWSGIGFGVVILLCIAAMFYMILSGKKEAHDVKGGLLPPPGAKAPAAPPLSSPSEVTPARAAGTREALIKKLRPEPVGSDVQPPVPTEEPPAPSEESLPPAETGGPEAEDFGTGIE